MSNYTTLALPSSTASCVRTAILSMPEGLLKEGYQVRGTGKSAGFWKAELGTDATLQRALVSVFGAVASATATSSANDALAAAVLPEPAAEPAPSVLKQAAAIHPDEATRREIAKLRAQIEAIPANQPGTPAPTASGDTQDILKALSGEWSSKPSASEGVSTPAKTKKAARGKKANAAEQTDTQPIAKPKIDLESRDLLRYISEDFVLFVTGGRTVAYHIESGDELNKEGFKHYCAKHYGDVFLVSLDENGNAISTRTDAGPIWWEWNDPWRRVVRRFVMVPTEVSEEDWSEPQVYNRWYFLKTTMAEPNPAATTADIAPFLNHLMYISDGDEVVVMYFMNWLANLYQFPGTKLPSAILMYSRVGRIGKSMIYKLLKQVFGPPLCATADGSIINSKFMDAMEHKRIVFLNEMSRSDKLDSYERFKSLISEEETTFEGKGRAAKGIDNVAHYIITTNHEDALPLMEGDGRIAIFRCLADRKDNAYYKAMHDWFEGPGPAALAQCLATWKFPADWDAHAPVPQTAAAKALQHAARPAAVSLVQDLIDDSAPPFDKDIGQSRSMLEQMTTLYGASMGGVNERSLGKALSTLDCIRLGNRKNQAYGAWCWRNHDFWAAQDAAVWRAYLLQGVVPKGMPATEAVSKANVSSISEGKTK